jgi:hypothetical protein
MTIKVPTWAIVVGLLLILGPTILWCLFFGVAILTN